MKIVILGAGQVGASLVEHLASEANDITVVDTDRERLALLQDRYDLRTVVGDAATPAVLDAAGTGDADLLVAATRSDPANLVACKLAHSRFNVPRRVARLRSADFFADPTLFAPEHFAVTEALCPEQEVTDTIVRLVEFPRALQVLEFGAGRLTLVGVRAYEGGLLVGHPIREMRRHLPPDIDARIAALYRRDRPLMPDGDTRIEVGDEVFFIAPSEHLPAVLRELRREEQPVRQVVVAGAGNIGARVAAALQGRCRVTVVEASRQRAEEVADRLDDALVLCGGASDEDVLEQANIAEADLFLALTNDDEDNILAASLAKRLGSRRVLALINRRVYADMVQGGPIDIALSPAEVSAGAFLAHVRQGDVVQVHRLRRGAAEALELVVHGDARTSKVVGRRIADLDLPEGVSVAALVRNMEIPEVLVETEDEVETRFGQVIMAHHDTVVQAGDHVILFCTRKEQVPKVVRLFQVAFGFL